MNAEAILHRSILCSEAGREAAASAPQRGQQFLILGVLPCMVGKELLICARGVEGDEGLPLVSVVAVSQCGAGCRLRVDTAVRHVAASHCRRALTAGPRGGLPDRGHECGTDVGEGAVVLHVRLPFVVVGRDDGRAGQRISNLVLPPLSPVSGEAEGAQLFE